MGIKRKIGLLVFATAGLAACTGTLSQEEVGTQSASKAEDVRNYQAEITLNVFVNDAETEEVVNESKSFMDVTLDEETLDGFGTIRAESLGNTVTQNYYSVGDKAYMKLDEGKWTDVSAQQAEYFQNTDTLYKELMPIVEVMAEQGEMTNEDGNYLLTYKGTNAQMYEAFEGPYNLSFGSVAPEDINQDITLIIDGKTLFIESLINRLTANENNYDLEIYIEQDYSDINQIEEFSIPQEVIDEAGGAS